METISKSQARTLAQCILSMLSDALSAVDEDLDSKIETIKVNNTALTPTNKAVNIDLSGYVATETGKVLSTNDYTTTEKNKLSGIAEGAQVNIIESVKVNGTALTPSSKAVNIDISGKLDIATAASTYFTKVSAAKCTVPEQDGTLIFDGTVQSPCWLHYDSAKMSISGDTSATNAGTYTAIFTLNSGYTWQDGTTTAKSVTWSIQRAAAAINVHNPQFLKIPSNSEVSLAFTVVGAGDISAISADTDTATVSINFLQKIITVSAVSNGTTSITLSLPQSTNYDAISVTINVRVSSVSDIYTISLLKGEESALTDECSLEWTEENHNEYPVAISTTTSKFGNSSLYLNKKGESIHSSLCTLGGQDFTVDWWAYLGTPSGSATDGQRSITRVCNSEAEFFSFLFTGNNQIYFRILLSGGSSNRTGISVPLNEWHHFAVVYSHTAGKVYFFVDGVLKVTRTGTLARYTDMISYIGGGDPNYTAAYPYPNTYVDNYRISDGIARWTANFTPPNENEY